MPKIISPKNTAPVTAIWAVISADDTGEGICAGITPDGRITPLICASESNVAWLKEQAQIAAFAVAALGADKRIKLIKMTAREELEDYAAEPTIGSGA